jgi:carboxymethylenebutenolidase
VHTRLPSGTDAFVVHSEGADRGLVVIPDIWGLRPLFERVCHDLAARTGWSVATLEPFPGQNLPGADSPEGFERRAAALRDRDDTAMLADVTAVAELTGCEHVGLIGFCMGGMYALKASAIGRFDRVVSFYGMARVPPEFEGPGQGQPLDALSDRGDCEVFAVMGTEDPFLPPEDIDALESAGVVTQVYEGAEHGFVHDPERPSYRPDDAADAWDRALRFLDGLT